MILGVYISSQQTTIRTKFHYTELKSFKLTMKNHQKEIAIPV